MKFNFFEGNYKKLLIVPLILFILFFALIFVMPGIERGRDLVGGTSITIRGIENQINLNELETLLDERFDLKDLQFTQIGEGMIIEYAQNNTLASAKTELDSAKDLLESNPEQAIENAGNANNLLSAYNQNPIPSNLSAEETVEFVETNYIDARQAFSEQLQNTIISEFSLGENVSFRKSEIGPTLGAIFWDSASKVAIISAILVIIVIFIFFREIIPSIAVILAAIFDVLGALALMALFKVPLDLGSISALLMLIGYSVDTDIMLTIRVLKRKEKNPKERTKESMKTGLTMTLTTIAAVSAMAAISFYYQIGFIFTIASVILFGLLADLVSTWMMNAPILLWYAEKKQAKRGY